MTGTSSHTHGALGGVRGPLSVTHLPARTPGQQGPLHEGWRLLGGQRSDSGPLSSWSSAFWSFSKGLGGPLPDAWAGRCGKKLAPAVW